MLPVLRHVSIHHEIMWLENSPFQPGKNKTCHSRNAAPAYVFMTSSAENHTDRYVIVTVFLLLLLLVNPWILPGRQAALANPKP